MVTSNSSSLIVRQATQADSRAIRRLLDENWAVHTRILPIYLQNRLENYIAYVAQDQVALRGLMIVEPQPPSSSLIVMAAVHDNLKARPVLEALLHDVELALQDHHLKSIMQLGEAPWLTRELPKFDFKVTNRIVTYEWVRQPLPNIRPHSQLQIRSARLNDLPNLLELDRLAFGPMWHKPRTAFREALSRAASFTVGLIQDTVVAYEWCDLFGDVAHLTRIATHPDYQGVGIATQLLHHTLQTLLELNVNTVSLNTQENNTRSQELYRRFGFKQTRQIVNVYWKELG